MLFSKFKSLLSKVIDLPLPGIEAQKKMVPMFRVEELVKKPLDKKTAKKSAVLLLFYPNLHGDTCFVLIERGLYNGVHSGQISFPGGKKEPNDITFWDTALREAKEEVGVSSSEIEQLKTLSTFYIPPSNFIVYPFMGLINNTPFFKKEVKEVEKIIEVPLYKLLDPSNETRGTIKTSYAGEVDVPMYVFDDVKVWGATATVLSEMKELILTTLKE